MSDRPRVYLGGMAGAGGPGRPPFTRAPESYPDKPIPPPAELRTNEGGGMSPHQDGRTPVALPAMNFPPEGSYPIDVVNDLSLAAGATGVVIEVPVPAATQFRIEGLGFDAYDPIALSFLTWTLFVGGTPYRAYSRQTAGIGSIRQCSGIVFHVRDNALVQLSLTSSALVTYQFVARMRGWLFTDEKA